MVYPGRRPFGPTLQPPDSSGWRGRRDCVCGRDVHEVYLACTLSIFTAPFLPLCPQRPVLLGHSVWCQTCTHLEQWFSNFRVHQNHLNGLLKTNCWAAFPKFDWGGLGRAWKLSSSQVSLGAGAPLWEPLTWPGGWPWGPALPDAIPSICHQGAHAVLAKRSLTLLDSQGSYLKISF